MQHRSMQLPWYDAAATFVAMLMTGGWHQVGTAWNSVEPWRRALQYLELSACGEGGADCWIL